MKKLIIKGIVTALALTLTLSTVGCGPALDTDGVDSSKTQIYVSLYEGGHGTDYFDALIDKFMAAHPEYDEKYQIRYEAEKIHPGLVADELSSGVGDKQMYVMSQNEINTMIYSGYLEDLSDVVEMKPDGASGKAIKDKINRYDEWQSIYTDKLNTDGKNQKSIYSLPYADSVLGYVYDHDMFVENGWYFLATADDLSALGEQGITYTTSDGKYIFQSCDHDVNYEVGDEILSRGKDGKFGTYDDGQPTTESEWDEMIMKISASGTKVFISSGKIEDYSQSIISALTAQYAGLDAYNTYFTYDSKGEAVDLADGSKEVITLENGYKAMQLEAIYKAYEFMAKYFDTRSNSGLVSLHPAVTDGTKSHIDTQSLFILGYQKAQTNPQSALLTEGAWWEYEARAAFNELGRLNYDRGYGKREYRYMLLPNLEGQKLDKSAMSCCESGCFILPKDSNKERLAVTKEFLAYMCSDEALKYFTLTTGSIMPYDYTFTKEEKNMLTPFTRNMMELYFDKENVEIVRPQVMATYSPLSYASGKGISTHFTIKLSGISISAPIRAVRERTLAEIKTGLALRYSAEEWSEYIAEAKAVGFFK